jgi:predicted nucleic acid-binding protein
LDRLFLDANVLFSVAYAEASPLVRLWRLDGAQLLTSAYAVAEARRNLGPGARAERLEGPLASATVVAEPLDAGVPAGVDLREKDVPILAAAIASRASHLLTLDRRDFGPYLGKTVEGVRVLHPRDYGGVSRRE